MTTKLPPPLPGSPIGISTKPTRLRWTLDDLLSRDGHRISIAFTCTAAAVDEPAERQLFAETFSASATAGSQSAIAHFLPSLRAAGADLARQETAEDLLGIPARARWATALKTAANETAFGCGIEVLAPFDVEVTSPTLQKERLEQMQRAAAERRSADRVEHFARAAELLKQWESLKASVPSITPGKLLEQVNPADRGLMLDTLLMASSSSGSSKTDADLWAVSGSQLVRMDARTDSPQTKVIELPTNAGPLRSIRPSNGKLLIGARNGVLSVEATKPDSGQIYLHPALSSEYGFTSVTRIDNRLWACHREGGLVGWDIGHFNQPAQVFSTAGLGAEPRHLTDRGIFAAGAKLFRLTGSSPTPAAFSAAAAIVALLPLDEQLIVIDECGAIDILDGQSLEKISDLNVAGRITSAALLPWLSSSRLLLNRVDGPIECIGLEDQLVTRFGGNHTGMRAVTSSAGKIAAMSNDRQRVLLWNAWDGRTPAGEIYLTGMTHHRIADLAFG
jgi:hypothetical protein